MAASTTSTTSLVGSPRALRRWESRALAASIFLASMAIAPSPTLAGQLRPRLVVLDFKTAGGINGDLVNAYSEKLLTALHSTNAFDEMGTGDLEAIVGFQKIQDVLGCSEVECFADIAGAVGVDILLTGTLLKDPLSDTYTVLAKVIDTRRVVIGERIEHRVAGGVPALLGSANDVIAELFDLSEWLQRINGGSIDVRSPNRPISIGIDGETAARQPGIIAGISPGRHDVVVESPGYHALVQEILVRRGEHTVLNATLRPLARLQIVSTPTGAAVSLDGRDLGVTPASAIGLHEGAHRIAISMPGHRPVEQVISLADGTTARLEASLLLDSEYVQASSDTERARAIKKQSTWMYVGLASLLGVLGTYAIATRASRDEIRGAANPSNAVDEHNQRLLLGYALGVGALGAGGLGIYSFATMPRSVDERSAVLSECDARDTRQWCTEW